MATAKYMFLHFTNLKDIPNWSVQYADEEDLGFTKKFPMARIGSFLVKSRDIIEVQDDVEYKQVTLKINNGGVVPRNNGATLKGSKIGTKRQHVIHAGQFILSKIDARNGAYGIVPSELEGAIVTNDFPVFDVDTKKIIPQFLVLVSTTNKFVEFARKCSSGTTNRKRIDIDAFLNQQIPLPSIEEQVKILSEYNKRILLSKDILKYKKELGLQKEGYLKRILKFEYKKNSHKGLLNFIFFRRIVRWDVQYFSSDYQVFSQYETRTLGDSLSFFMKDHNSSLRIETNKCPNKTFHYIGMENILKEEGRLLNMPAVKGCDIKSQTVRIPKGFMIYGKLRPYLNKYWVNDTDIEDIVCSSEFFCFKPSESFNQDYFKYILSSYIIQEQISDAMTGARMPRIDENIFKQIIIPIPPISIQNNIAEALKDIDKQMIQMKDKADYLQREAFVSFQNTLFEL